MLIDAPIESMRATMTANARRVGHPLIQSHGPCPVRNAVIIERGSRSSQPPAYSPPQAWLRKLCMALPETGLCLGTGTPATGADRSPETHTPKVPASKREDHSFFHLLCLARSVNPIIPGSKGTRYPSPP